jgi:hypothetical protein
MFVRVRRLEKQAAKTRAGQTILSSGEPKTHPTIASNITEEHRLPVEYVDHFVCTGGVNVVPLLRATRSTLLDRVEHIGANTLTDEQWECTISGPKQNNVNGTYKVEVRYHASATKSAARDPHRPVALEEAKGIPGLMTIIKRNDA